MLERFQNQTDEMTLKKIKENQTNIKGKPSIDYFVANIIVKTK